MQPKSDKKVHIMFNGNNRTMFVDGVRQNELLILKFLMKL